MALCRLSSPRWRAIRLPASEVARLATIPRLPAYRRQLVCLTAFSTLVIAIGNYLLCGLSWTDDRKNRAILWPIFSSDKKKTPPIKLTTNSLWRPAHATRNPKLRVLWHSVHRTNCERQVLLKTMPTHSNKKQEGNSPCQ